MERYKLKQIVYILGDYHGLPVIYKAKVIGIKVDNDDNYTYTLEWSEKVINLNEKNVFASVKELVDNLASCVVS